MSNELMNLSFENHNVRTVNRDGEIWWVLKDVCSILDIADHHQIWERIDEDERGKYQIPTPGGKQEMKCINEFGLYKVVIRSDKPDASRFRRWVTHEVLPSIRKTGSYISPTQQIENLELRLKLAEQKLQLFEEYNEDILYDFHQVASAMLIYRKPPFGEKLLKHWLADHKILCLPYHKNDKPVQKYIDNGWFKLVMHEWKRHGVRRYEPRYMITQRGFNGIIDIAIREKVIEIPSPKQMCLLDLAENKSTMLAVASN